MATPSEPAEKQVTARAVLSTAVAWPIAASDTPRNQRVTGAASPELVLRLHPYYQTGEFLP
jgi:hypothetical protein